MEFTGERFVPGIKEYDTTPMAFEHWQRYYAVLESVRDKVVVDIACGEGYGSNLIAESAGYVYGIDISEEAVCYAASTYTKENLEFLIGSVNNLAFSDNSIDVIISFETIEHVDTETQRAFMSEAKRILKSDGLLILSCPNQGVASDFAFEMWGYRNEFHIKEFYLEEFKVFLMQYFSHVQLAYQRYEKVLLLSSPQASKLDIILRKQNSFEHAQNMIAICSLTEIKNCAINSIVLEEPGEYLDMTRERVQLEKELYKKNSFISSLEMELSVQKCLLNKEKETCESLARSNEELTRSKVQMQGSIQLLQLDLLQQQATIQDQRRTILHLQSVLGAYEEELKRIASTRSWRLLNVIHKVKQKIKSRVK